MINDINSVHIVRVKLSKLTIVSYTTLLTITPYECPHNQEYIYIYIYIYIDMIRESHNVYL